MISVDKERVTYALSEKLSSLLIGLKNQASQLKPWILLNLG